MRPSGCRHPTVVRARAHGGRLGGPSLLPLWSRCFLSSFSLPSLISRGARSRRRIGRKPAHPRRHIGNRVAACRRAPREQVGNEKKRYEARLHPTDKPRFGPRTARRATGSGRHAPGLTIPRPDRHGQKQRTEDSWRKPAWNGRKFNALCRRRLLRWRSGMMAPAMNPCWGRFFLQRKSPAFWPGAPQIRT